MALLDSFLTHRGAGYARGSISPLSAERVGSRLSPYLAIGALSVQEVANAVKTQAEARDCADWGPSLRAFQRRLSTRAGLAPITEFPEHHTGGVLFDAWRKGQTGLPYLDACMRYLIATGWINFPARAMLVSVAAHHFRLDWQAVGHVLARRFTDYDPAIHWPQVQAHGGATGQQARLIDPVKQGKQHDPNGVFTRRWVPELAGVPDAFLQTPWKWSGAQTVLGRRYPEPVVDIATATRDARAVMRRETALAEVEVIEPCARRGMFFSAPNAGTRRARVPVAGQLSLDL
jgi:deoxyribodipyrimidine photo-lyase